MNAIEGTNLSFSYGGIEVFKDLSFSIKENDFIVVLGRNGAGKTTLIQLILGLLPKNKGTIQLFGKDSSEFNDWGSIGYVPQKYVIDKNFPGTIREILELKQSNSSVNQMLGIDEFMHKRFSELSGGQQQRVLIAFALLQKPKLLILDEPTVGVDMQAQREFYGLLKKLNKEGMTIVLITHDVGLISKYAKSVMCMGGNSCCSGPIGKRNALLRRVCGPEFEIFAHEKGHHHA